MNDQGSGGLPGCAGRPATLFCCILLAAFGIMTVFLCGLQNAAPSWQRTIADDALRFAETAKNLARLNGFTSGWIWPYQFNFSHDVARMPDLFNPPIYCMVLGAFFAVFGTHSLTILLCTTALFVATGICVFLFAKGAFGQDVALTAAVLFLANRLVILKVLEGYNLILLIFLVNALFWSIYATRMATPRAAAGIGALVGLCYLTEYPYWVLLLPLGLCCLAAEGGRRRMLLAALVAGFCAVSSWWWLRNLLVTGNPFFTLRVGYGQYGRLFTCVLNPVLRGGRGLLSFGTRSVYLQRQVSKLMLVFGSWLGPLFVAAAFWRCENAQMQWTRKVVYAVFATVVLLVGTWSGDVYSLGLLFLPFVCIIVSAFAFSIATACDTRRLPVRLAITAGLVLAAHSTWFGGYSEPFTYTAIPTVPYRAPKGSVFFSDCALRLAWLMDTPAIEMPREPEECAKIAALVPGKKAAYLSPDFDTDYGEDIPFWHQVWMDALEGALSRDLPFAHGDALDQGDYLFY